MTPRLRLEDILMDRSAEEEIETSLSDGVFYGFLALAALIILFTIGTLFFLGGARGRAYTAQAAANMSDVRVVQGERGAVTDRFGAPLTSNIRAFQAFLVPREVPREAADRDALFAALQTVLGIPRAELEAEVEKKGRYFEEYVTLDANLSHEELVALSEHPLPAVRVEEGFRRVYDPPLAFSHALGYAGLVNGDEMKAAPELSPYDLIGRAGIEAQYDAYLRGRSGKELFYRDAKGEVRDMQVVQVPEAGDAVRTYLDRELQEYFYNRMRQELDRLGRKVGVGIAMNPQNGEVLALFGVPGYDAGRIAAYLNDSARPLFNRAVSGVYNPGSAIKPLHALAALAEGVISPRTRILSTGQLEIPNPYTPSQPSIFKDWKAHGLVDVRSALARSSNVYFYEIGGGFRAQKGLGIVRLKEWWEKFLLDKPTGIDLPHEAAGLLPDPEWKKKKTGTNWVLGDTYHVSIGQGDFAVTPVALLNYVNAIANGGELYRPRIVDRITDAEGVVRYQSRPEARTSLRGAIVNVLQEVREGMYDTVRKEYGTAYTLHDLPFRVAAKTGSAQIEGNRKTNAFFVGYAFDKNDAAPVFSVMVLVEDAREGSLNTVPIARDVFAWYYENRIREQ